MAEQRLEDVLIARCIHSRFNTRKTRSEEQVKRLAERIQRNGFERTRAIWGHEVNGHVEIFAGGTRLEAARLARLSTVPVMLHDGIDEAEVSRRADLDNENDEYHVPVSIVDVWAEYHRLYTEEPGWNDQQKIADAKGVTQPDVANRVRLHTLLGKNARKAVLDGTLDEGHCLAFLGVVLDVQYFATWLTTKTAQDELVAEVLGTHRGKTSSDPDIKKPTVASVREKARRWKEMIGKAEANHKKLAEEKWQAVFVRRLAEKKARTLAAVEEAYKFATDAKAMAAQLEAERARQQAEEADAEQVQAETESRRSAFLLARTARVLHGDARNLMAVVPAGFSLLLTDPPYGMDYQSQRRKTSSKKEKVANDDPAVAIALLTDVLKAAFPLLAEHATILIFTGWRHEPAFRAVVESAGFTIKGRLIWAKSNHGTGDLKGSFAPKHEGILHAVKGSPELRRREADVLTGNEFTSSGHPTEKPMDLLRTLIEATTSEGDTVVDPFVGCGNTLVAAYATGRKFYGIELDDEWHRHVVDRIHELATKELESNA